MRNERLAHRDHAPKALWTALVLKRVRPRAPRPPFYGEPVIEALRFCWAVLGTPCGRLQATALRDPLCRACDGSKKSRLKCVPGIATQVPVNGPGVSYPCLPARMGCYRL